LDGDLSGLMENTARSRLFHTPKRCTI
jgi:hypothetical protein